MQDSERQNFSLVTPSTSSSSSNVGLSVEALSPSSPRQVGDKRLHSPDNSPSKLFRSDKYYPESVVQAHEDLVRIFGDTDALEVNSDATTDVDEREQISLDTNLIPNQNHFEDSSVPVSPMQSQTVYPANLDQNRQEMVQPQTVHLYMHQFCNCMHTFYPGCRPPIMAPYPVPIPRPFNLQHYQYTHLNVSPYSFPAIPANAAIPQPSALPGAYQPLDFGPPPRDRRSLDNGGGEVTNEVSAENPFEDLPERDNFTKYLEQGCVCAEKIAIRNQHRPCFKNIQNLCSRTRSEILKPCNTVSNIHSQGIPWATKDFIYAYVRLINCWHMLKGYLDTKDGTLGNIDRELTPEFKNCYVAWEENTKELSAHMIRIFTNLDGHVNNPAAVAAVAAAAANRRSKENPQKAPPSARTADEKTANCVFLQGIPETIDLTESTGTSPRDSDNEGRVYMRPGSYNVPKRNDSPNSSPSIEFFETAQNVSAHYKKMAQKRQETATFASDQVWQNAQSAAPLLINKMTHSSQFEHAGNAPGGGEGVENALQYMVDLSNPDRGSTIQQWLNTNNFFDNQNGNGESDAAHFPRSSNPVAVFQGKLLPKLTRIDNLKEGEPVQRGCGSSTARSYRKRNEATSSRKKDTPGIWEYDQGGLTAKAVVAVENILKNLEKEEFTKSFLSVDEGKVVDDDLKVPASLTAIKRKLTSKKYKYVQEFVRDMRSLVGCSIFYYQLQPEIREQMSAVKELFEELLSEVFPNFDFSDITGDPEEKVGPAILMRGKKTNGGGDH